MGQERETDEGRCGFEEQGKGEEERRGKKDKEMIEGGGVKSRQSVAKEGKRCTRTEMGNDSILSSPSLINHHSCGLIPCILLGGVNIMTGWR